MNAHDFLLGFFEAWDNSWLTLGNFAEEHNVSPELAGELIDLGRKLYNSETSEQPA